MRYISLSGLLLVANFATAASPSTIDEVKAALASLRGDGALRGTYEVRSLETTGKETPELEVLSAQVEDGADGMAVRWDHALLRRAEDEATQAPKPDHKLVMLIQNNSATRIAAAVNYAPNLLGMLTRSRVESERDDSWQGKPARLLELAVTSPPFVGWSGIKVKENTHHVKLWLGPDRVPLAASIRHKLRASVALVFTYEQNSTQDLVFSQVANRLVVLKRREEGVRKGGGDKGSYRNAYSFTPRT